MHQLRGAADPQYVVRRLEVDTLEEFRRNAVAAVCIVSSRRRFLTVVMDISNKCNLRCRMCYFALDKYFKAPPVFMTPEQFDGIAANLLPHAQTLSLSCGNEPLTSPHFIDILKRIQRHGVPNVDFTTNGLLLDERNTDAIVRYGVTDVSFSVDGATKSTYEQIRRGGRFDRLVTNITRLNERKRTLGTVLPRLRFNITLMRSNIAEVEELVVLARRLGIGSLDFRHVLVWDGLGMEAESLFHHQQLSNAQLHRAVRKAGELGLKIVAHPGYFPDGNGTPTPPDRTSLRSRITRLMAQSLRDVFRRKRMGCYFFLMRRQPFPYCRLPFSYVLINAGGAVYPCPYCHGEAPYGIVGEGHALRDVWFSDAYKTLRRRIIENDPPDMCRVCPSQRDSSLTGKRFDAKVV
jgi:MoaA/NifB/PqqE/SkfB family radical SAM enzyme